MDATRRLLLAWGCGPLAASVAATAAAAATSGGFAAGSLAATSPGGTAVGSAAPGAAAVGSAAGGAVAAADARAPALARGVNLTHWFEYERSQSVQAVEFAAMKRCGLDHVRLPVDPVVFGWTLADRSVLDAGSAFRRAFDAPLRAAVDAALQAGLDVVVDLHFTGETKQAIEDDASLERAVERLWTHIASRLVGTPSARVAVELLNEPQYYGFARLRWPAFQRRLLAAVRVVLPEHLVLASGSAGASVEGLAALNPLADPRVAYVFHYYLPYLFTHQGADWMDTRYTRAGLFHDVRYPAAVQAGVEPRLSAPHPKAAADLADYRKDDWNDGRMAASMRPAFDWARRHGARVVCNEFGVIRAGVQPASRYRWLGDVRRVLEAQGIGWTVWDYKDIFGIAGSTGGVGSPGSPGSTGSTPHADRSIEPEALAALGLRGSS